jgi:hypothetical protein
MSFAMLSHQTLWEGRNNMSRELQSHMHEYVVPSIYKEMSNHVEPKKWLAMVYADQLWDHGMDDVAYTALVNEALELIGYSLECTVEEIAEKAISFGSTPNGANGIYLDRTGWICVPWCTEEECMEYWDNR